MFPNHKILKFKHRKIAVSNRNFPYTKTLEKQNQKHEH
jgi:hypothetical protein